MRRRAFLAGTAASAAIGLAGCTGVFLDDGSTGDAAGDRPVPNVPSVTDDDPNDGRAPAATFDGTPSEPDFDPDAFDTTTASGVEIMNGDSSMEVKLAPAELVYDWYRRQEVRMVDGRGAYNHEQMRIFGAVLSTVGSPIEETPVGDWSKSDRIVTYCGCPHHISSVRAAELMNAGYEEVYALDEGIYAPNRDDVVSWYEHGYPVTGSSVQEQTETRLIEGVTDATFAGKSAWATDLDAGQREATTIDAAGRYVLHLNFFDVTDETPIRLETPEYTVEASLGELTDGTVEAPN